MNTGHTTERILFERARRRVRNVGCSGETLSARACDLKKKFFRQSNAGSKERSSFSKRIRKLQWKFLMLASKQFLQTIRNSNGQCWRSFFGNAGLGNCTFQCFKIHRFSGVSKMLKSIVLRSSNFELLGLKENSKNCQEQYFQNILRRPGQILRWLYKECLIS